MSKIFRYNLDCGNLGNVISSKLTALIFLIYFSMLLRSKVNMTLLVVIVRHQLSAQIKSATISDLMFLSALLMLAICLLESTMNLSNLFELIRTKTCFLNRSLFYSSYEYSIHCKSL